MKIPRTWLHAARMAASLLFYPALVVVIWGELTPAPPAAIEHICDKALHFIAYFGLAWLAGVAVIRRATAIRAFVGLILLGGILEIVQGFTGRDMSVYDEVANTIGILVGGFAARVMVESLRRRMD